jgi:hypothetical protein
MTEFMPYTDPEWIEIYNNNNFPIKLVGWKIENSNGNTKSIDLSIDSKSYSIYELKSLIFNNNDDEKVILLNQDGQIITETSYSKGMLTDTNSWSYVSGSWCQTTITKGYENVSSCSMSTPTPTPTNILTLTPTSNSTRYIIDEEATASAIIEPQTEASFLSPTSALQPTPKIISGLVLGESTSSSSVTKKNYFPLILIISGGLLLITPVIITKVKSKK